MSVQAIAWAYSVELDNPGDKFLLVTLANFADEWGVCWPGQDTLARLTAQGERKVRAGLAALEAAGLILRVARRREDGTRRADVVVLTGFEGRRRAVRPEDHAAVDLVAVDRAAAEAAAARGGASADGGAEAAEAVDNRHDVPVDVHDAFRDQPASRAASTGISCRINRHVVPVTINKHDPSYEPSYEPDDEARAGARDGSSGSQERFDALVARICAALGDEALAESAWWRIEADFGRRITAWRALGLDDEEIVAAAEAFGRDVPERPRGPKALDGEMVRVARRKAQGAERPKRGAGEAGGGRGAGARDAAEFWAGKLKEGAVVPQTAVGPRLAWEMLVRGLVGPEDLLRAGLRPDEVDAMRAALAGRGGSAAGVVACG